MNPPTRGEWWPGSGKGAVSNPCTTAPSPCAAGNVLTAGYGLGGTQAGIYLLPFKSFPLLTPLYFPLMHSTTGLMYCGQVMKKPKKKD